MQTPKVSIVIPVYNGSDYLREAVDSALAQSYENIEVLVINDGSNDNGKTEAIAKSYGANIRYLYKKNGGVASALNLGIQEMQGEYFSWLSHDDVYYPDKIAKNIEFISKQKETVIVYSDYENIDGNGNLIKQIILPGIEQSKLRISLITERALHGCSLLIPTICFESVGLFNERLRTVQDYDLWLKLTEKYKFIHIPQILVKSRLHPDQDSRKITDIHRNEEERLFISWIQKLPEDELESFTRYKSVALTYLMMGTDFARKHNVITAKYLIKKSFSCFRIINIDHLMVYLKTLLHFFFIYTTKQIIRIKNN